MTHMTIKKTMLESISRFKSSKGDLLRAQGMTMAVWAACLCPLLFLLNASQPPLRCWLPAAALLLALLCPLMLIFIALPMRQSTAEAMQLFLSGAPMATVAMLPLNGYWKKVARSLRMTGLMLLWLLPFAIMLGLLLYALTGMDFLTALGYLSSLGGGDFGQGIIRYVMLMMLMLLFPLFGVMFHSGTRHACALNDRKLVKGHRGQLIRLWLSGLMFVLPVAICVVALIAVIGVSAVQFTTEWFNNLMAVPSMSALMPPKWLLAVTAVSAVLMLVTNPMRSLLPAIFLRGVKDEKEQEDAAA